MISKKKNKKKYNKYIIYIKLYILKLLTFQYNN